MPAYVVVMRDEMKNPEQYAAYGQKAMASFAGTGAKLLVANGAFESIEGERPDGIVVIEFPTVEAAKAWYYSPAYQAAVGDRLASTTGRLVIVEGFPPG
jgi:uncharacterized protein (DUF1330 family)